MRFVPSLLLTALIGCSAGASALPKIASTAPPSPLAARDDLRRWLVAHPSVHWVDTDDEDLVWTVSGWESEEGSLVCFASKLQRGCVRLPERNTEPGVVLSLTRHGEAGWGVLFASSTLLLPSGELVRSRVAPDRSLEGAAEKLPRVRAPGSLPPWNTSLALQAWGPLLRAWFRDEHVPALQRGIENAPAPSTSFECTRATGAWGCTDATVDGSYPRDFATATYAMDERFVALRITSEARVGGCVPSLGHSTETLVVFEREPDGVLRRVADVPMGRHDRMHGTTVSWGSRSRVTGRCLEIAAVAQFVRRAPPEQTELAERRPAPATLRRGTAELVSAGALSASRWRGYGRDADGWPANGSLTPGAVPDLEGAWRFEPDVGFRRVASCPAATTRSERPSG